MQEYKTTGVCCRRILFDLKDDKIHGVQFEGGCAGNLAAISKLVEGMNAQQAIETLSGIDCGGRGTSCSDQLAKALTESLAAAS
ncbi:MAG: TIGR03905 family TSCPD domain-containing protein [Defluviitaleaceae bacterium]|nr:TIGR03905 family TSCPD domain-containing protein [Defluviitaleaceae bacterium]